MTVRAGITPTQGLEEVVRRTAARHLLFVPGVTTVVGFSGGPDSLALLHVLRKLASEWDLTVHAAHLDHRLRGTESDADAAFVRDTCLAWGIPLTVEAFDVRREAECRGLSVEEAARQVRYAFFGRVAAEVGAATVAVGHNADDQVETVLMHFLRGSGLGGLRGMQPSSALVEAPCGSVRLARPLLYAPRDMVLAYCDENGLRPRFDRSNLDTTYFRNRLRLELVPYLETFNPAVRAVVRRSAEVLSADYDFFVEARDRAWDEVVRRADASEIEFDLAAFRALHLSLRRALIRRAIERLRPPLRNIDWVHVEQAVETVQNAAGAGVKADLPQGLLLVVGYDSFSVGDAERAGRPGTDYPQLPEGCDRVELSVPGLTALTYGWRVTAEIRPVGDAGDETVKGEDRWVAHLDRAVCGKELELRPRREGERMWPLGMEGHSKKLKALMIDAKIPAVYRARYPILAGSEGALWLPGYHIDHRARVTDRTTEVVIVRVERP